MYNVNETGVFYKLLPEWSLDAKNKKCHGGRKHKERVTVVVAANMDGATRGVPSMFCHRKVCPPHVPARRPELVGRLLVE